MGEDGRVAVGDEPVVQLGGLVVQQDAGGGEGGGRGLAIKAQQKDKQSPDIRYRS